MYCIDMGIRVRRMEEDEKMFYEPDSIRKNSYKHLLSPAYPLVVIKERILQPIINAIPKIVQKE